MLDYQYFGPQRKRPVLDLASALFGFGVGVLAVLAAIFCSLEPVIGDDE